MSEGLKIWSWPKEPPLSAGEQLQKLAQTDLWVATHLRALERGIYDSREQMLECLAVDLAVMRARYAEELAKLSTRTWAETLRFEMDALEEDRDDE